jgi:hypothetical protein
LQLEDRNYGKVYRLNRIKVFVVKTKVPLSRVRDSNSIRLHVYTSTFFIIHYALPSASPSTTFLNNPQKNRVLLIITAIPVTGFIWYLLKFKKNLIIYPHNFSSMNINSSLTYVCLFVAEASTSQHTTLTTKKHPCPRWDSNPQSQQASGCITTP